MKSYVQYCDLVQPKLNDFEKVGKVSTASVLKCTGKHWKEWVDILVKVGARSWSHPEIVAFLKKKYKLTPWWQQGVAMGFEIATGRRGVGQDAKGKYMVTATKSLPCEVGAVWKFLMSEEGLKVWLQPLFKVKIQPKSQFETKDGYFGEVRTIALNRRARLFWQDPEWEKHTVVELMLVPKPKKKSILVFNHTGLPDLKSKELLKVRWRKVADQILGYI